MLLSDLGSKEDRQSEQ